MYIGLVCNHFEYAVGHLILKKIHLLEKVQLKDTNLVQAITNMNYGDLNLYILEIEELEDILFVKFNTGIWRVSILM